MEIRCCSSCCEWVCVIRITLHPHIQSTRRLKCLCHIHRPPATIYVSWKSLSNSDNLYEMEIRGEYYHCLCPWHEGYFKRQLVCLWFRRKERRWHKLSLSLNSRCTFLFILLVNEEWWKKQGIKVCSFTVCLNTAKAKWRNKFSFENSQ